MVLAIDIDNSKINFGFFDNKANLISVFGIATDINKTSDEYAVLVNSIFNYYKIERETVEGAAVSSVVPTITSVVCDAVNKVLPEINLVVVGKGIKTGFSIKVDNPSELGSDLVANAVAVMEIKHKENNCNRASVIVDLGTASTVFVLNSKNEFIGGSIMPGVDMSLNSLHGNTAQLPSVALVSPAKIIGKNSQDSIRSGVIFGTAIMIDGFVDRFSRDLGLDETDVFITGEYAEFIMPFCSCKYRYVSNLTLLGLYYVYINNIDS